LFFLTHNVVISKAFYNMTYDSMVNPNYDRIVGSWSTQSCA